MPAVTSGPAPLLRPPPRTFFFHLFASRLLLPFHIVVQGPQLTPDHPPCVWHHVGLLIPIDTFKPYIDLVTLGCQDPQFANEKQRG